MHSLSLSLPPGSPPSLDSRHSASPVTKEFSAIFLILTNYRLWVSALSRAYSTNVSGSKVDKKCPRNRIATRALLQFSDRFMKWICDCIVTAMSILLIHTLHQSLIECLCNFNCRLIISLPSLFVWPTVSDVVTIRSFWPGRDKGFSSFFLANTRAFEVGIYVGMM